MADKGFGVKEINLIGASGTPTIESPNNINLNAVNVAISTNVSIGGTLSVTGNISIGGTLTYEDVTNIDSVGLITARNGVFIPDTKKLEVGNAAGSGDLKIHHTSGNTFIENGTGTLKIRGATIEFSNPSAAQMLQANSTAAVNLYFNGNKKFETTNSGITVTGGIEASGNVNIDSQGATTTLQIISDTESSIDFNDHGGSAKRYKIGTNISDNSGQFEIKDITANIERLRIKSDGETNIGTGAVNIAKFCQSGNHHQIVGQAADNVAALDVYSQHGNDGDRLSFAVSDNRTGTKSNAFVVRGNGRVGIGTDNPGSYRTQIETTDQNVLRLVNDSDNADGVELVLQKDSASPADGDNIGNIYFQGNDDGGNATFYSSIEAYSDDVSNNSEDGYIRFRTRNDGTMGERLRIDSLGRLLVGTTAGWGSDVKLHLANSTNTYLTITSGTSHNGVIAFSDDGSERASIDYDHNGDFMVFKTNGNTGERLRITSDGVVLIGTDTKPNDINKLVVRGTSPADSFDSQCHLEGSETSGAAHTGGALAFAGHDGSSYRNWGNIYGMKENSTGGNTASYMAFHTRPNGGSPTERVRIASDGEVFIGDGIATADRNTVLSVSGSNQDPGAVWTTMGIYSSDSQAQNKGGSLGFGGQDGSTTKQQFAAISGVKENGTSGNYAGRLRFWTRPSGAVTKERMMITSAGKVGVNCTPTHLFHISESTTLNTGVEPNNPAEFSVAGPNKTLTGGGANAYFSSNDAMAADKGGQISFTGRTTASSTFASNLAVIKGAKENGTSTNVNAYLAFAVSNHNAGGLVERLRIQSGGGISFNGDTASANALDDYEEGTWTPTIQFSNGGNTATYNSNRGGWYVKVGRMVTLNGRIAISAKGSGSSAVYFGGLPFTVGNHNSGDSSIEGGLTISYMNDVNADKGSGIIGGYANESSTYAVPFYVDTSNNFHYVEDFDLESTASIGFVLTYCV